MKKRSVIFTAAFSTALIFSVLPAGKLSSCGPTLAADESRLALFRTGLDDNSGLKPFYYSENLFNLTDPDPEKIDQKENCNEWVNFSRNEVKRADVFSIQYETTADSFLIAYQSNDWKNFTGNSFIHWLQKKENHPALEYMALAKKAEAMFVPAPDPWDTTTAFQLDEFTSLSRAAIYAVSQNEPEFLKERYAFQAVKLLYYANDKKDDDQLLNIYDHYLKGKKTIVASWAMIYYAMRVKDADEKTLLLLNAFDASEEKKRFCYQQISLEDLSYLQEKTNDPKTTLLINTIAAIKNKGQALKNIKAVYSADPDSKYLPLLISREVNKLENWLWSPQVLGFYENYRPDQQEGVKRNYKKIRASDMKYLAEFRSWMEHTNLITGKPYEQLALIHLFNMEKNYSASQKLLDKLPATLNNRLEIQRQIEQLMLLSQSTALNKPIVQQQIATSVKKMMTLDLVFKHQIDSGYSTQEQYVINENEDDLSELLILLSNGYKKAGDMVTASLLYTKANITVNEYNSWDDNNVAVSYKKIAFLDKYGSPEDIDKLLQFKNHPGKTLFAQIIAPAKWGPEDMYKDLKGTMLLRRKQYKEALAVFNTIKPTFWKDNYEFKEYLPLTSISHTGNIIPGERSRPKNYPYVSKKLIIKDIVDLQEKINNATDDKTKAELNYKLANCYFNISYYGKAWMMFSYGKSYQDWGYHTDFNYNWAWYSFYPNSIKYGEDYYGCKSAMETYNLALSLTKDNELAAKCLLSLNFCKTSIAAYSDENKKSAVKTDYLKILTTNYRHTYNFKEAATTCADVKDYVEGKNK